MKTTRFFMIAAIVGSMLTGCSKDADPVSDTDWYTSNPSATSFNISTAKQLAGLAELVNEGTDFTGKTINLTSDINLSSYGSGKGWTPIGHSSEETSFRGTFDGKGKTVSGLYINDPERGGVGLFGNAKATIRNLHVDVAPGGITGWGYTGGIVGNLFDGGSSGKIENCYVTGGKIIGEDYVGGIAGHTGCVITKCYATVAVSGTDHVGGITGRSYHASLNVNACVALNTSVTTTGSEKGRVAGEFYKVLPTNNYGLSTMPGSWSNKGLSDLDGEDVLETNAQNSSFYASLGWDFTNVWILESSDMYPRLR